MYHQLIEKPIMNPLFKAAQQEKNHHGLLADDAAVVAPDARRRTAACSGDDIISTFASLLLSIWRLFLRRLLALTTPQTFVHI